MKDLLSRIRCSLRLRHWELVCSLERAENGKIVSRPRAMREAGVNGWRSRYDRKVCKKG